MSAPYLLDAFILATVLITGFDLYLRQRQIGFVRSAPPSQAPSQALDASSTADDHAKAVAYETANQRFGMVTDAVEAAVSIVMVAVGLGLLQHLADRIAPPGLAHGVLLLLGVVLVSFITQLPFSAYSIFVIETRFGFNRQSPGGFVMDEIKQTGLSIILTAALFALVLALMRTAGPFWWLFAWVAFVAFMLGLQIAFPRWIAPLFNTFAPLQGELKERLEVLLRRCGFEASALQTMDESRRTSHGNAYLSGFGRNKRIVLYDTLLAKHPADEIEAVLAHELGHFRLRHVHYGLALTLVMSFAGFFVVGEIARQAWFLEGFGYPGADDALSLILCMISFSVISPVSQMIGNAVSRHHELQADRFARDMTGAAPMISALLTLARENAQPIASDPLYALYNYSHPSMAERVAHLRAGA